jgi:chromosome segregation ATPase
MTGGFQGCPKQTEKQMPDGTRLREQVDEMTVRAEARAAAADEHQQIAAQRMETAERELQKLRLMTEVFAMGERLLLQKKKQILEGETPPTERQLGGLEDAITNVVELAQQAHRYISHNEGALAALNAMQVTLEQKAQEATARARGLTMQAERALGSADSAPAPQTAQEGAQGSEAPPLVTSVDGVSPVLGFLDAAPKTRTAE